MQLIRKLKKIKEYPPAHLFRILVEKLTFHTVQIRKFYLLAYAGFPRVANNRGPGLVRKGEPSDVAGMALLEDAVKQKIFQERFLAGEHCAVAEHKGKIVGYEWYSSSSIHIEQRYLYTISIPQDAVYAYDAFIQPEYRISGVWVRFKTFIGEEMKRLNKGRIITMIDSDNTLSLKTHTRFGYSVFKSIVVVNVAGKRYFSEKESDVRPTPAEH
jgi:hypothetical protein